jgi:hypothetical protein
VPGYRNQRLLFKLLEHVKFFSHIEVREYLRDAHRLLLPALPEVVFTKRSDRRRDVLITYVDGPGKSGAAFSALYAEENGIDAKLVVAPSDVTQTIVAMEKDERYVRAIVIVDDILATGRSLSENITAFVASIGPDLKSKSISVLIVAVTATPEGSRRVRETLKKLPNFEAKLVVCAPLPDDAYAFPERNLGFWADEKERDRAKALCLELGARIYRQNPLGYGGLGLLVTFTQTCPNNSLPILHSGRGGDNKWDPLFPRPVN